MEARVGSSEPSQDAAAALGALALTGVPPARKRRKFQLVTSVADACAIDDVLLKLQSRYVLCFKPYEELSLNLDNLNRSNQTQLQESVEAVNTGTAASVGADGVYRQIRSSDAHNAFAQQNFRLYDLVHEAADHRHNQLFR